MTTHYALLTHVRLVAAEVGKVRSTWLRVLSVLCDPLLCHESCLCLAWQGRSLHTGTSLRYRWLPCTTFKLLMAAPTITRECRPLILLHDCLVRRVEGVGLQAGALVTFLICRTDGVRSVSHGRAWDTLD